MHRSGYLLINEVLGIGDIFRNKFSGNYRNCAKGNNRFDWLSRKTYVLFKMKTRHPWELIHKRIFQEDILNANFTNINFNVG
jgi:hypothetical protein